MYVLNFLLRVVHVSMQCNVRHASPCCYDICTFDFILRTVITSEDIVKYFEDYYESAEALSRDLEFIIV